MCGCSGHEHGAVKSGCSCCCTPTLLERLKEEVELRGVAIELNALQRVESEAQRLVEWCYTMSNGEPGWRGEANMKGILRYVSELRFALDALKDARK